MGHAQEQQTGGGGDRSHGGRRAAPRDARRQPAGQIDGGGAGDPGEDAQAGHPGSEEGAGEPGDQRDARWLVDIAGGEPLSADEVVQLVAGDALPSPACGVEGEGGQRGQRRPEPGASAPSGWGRACGCCSRRLVHSRLEPYTSSLTPESGSSSNREPYLAAGASSARSLSWWRPAHPHLRTGGEHGDGVAVGGGAEPAHGGDGHQFRPVDPDEASGAEPGLESGGAHGLGGAMVARRSRLADRPSD